MATASNGTPNNDGVLHDGWADRPRDYLVFAVVRNPWDRFISGWRHQANTRNRPLEAVLANLPQEGADYRHVTRPQHVTLVENGHLVTDLLIRFESIQEGFAEMRRRLGLRPQELPVLNRGQHRHYSHYYTPATRETVGKLFAEDIERFGYQFEHEPRPRTVVGWARWIDAWVREIKHEVRAKRT